MFVREPERRRRRSVLRLPLLVGVLAAASLTVAVSPAASARGGLTASPAVVQFGSVTPGTISDEFVTITNHSGATVTLTTATPTAPTTTDPFWTTFSGSCNSNSYLIPPHSSCTLQWAFEPPAAGTYISVGTIYFDNGVTLTVKLRGTGT